MFMFFSFLYSPCPIIFLNNPISIKCFTYDHGYVRVRADSHSNIFWIFARNYISCTFLYPIEFIDFQHAWQSEYIAYIFVCDLYFLFHFLIFKKNYVFRTHLFQNITSLRLNLKKVNVT